MRRWRSWRLICTSRHSWWRTLRSSGGTYVNRRKLRIHLILVTSFFIGGILGALGFKHFGYVTTVPLAILLLLLVIRPVMQDIRAATMPARQT